MIPSSRIITALAVATVVSASQRSIESYKEWDNEHRPILEDICQPGDSIDVHLRFPLTHWESDDIPCFQMTTFSWPIYCPGNGSVKFDVYSEGGRSYEMNVETYLETYRHKHDQTVSGRYMKLKTAPGNVTACRDKGAKMFLALGAGRFTLENGEEDITALATAVQKGLDSLDVEGIRIIFYKFSWPDSTFAAALKLFKNHLRTGTKFYARVECYSISEEPLEEAKSEGVFDGVVITGTDEYCNHEPAEYESYYTSSQTSSATALEPTLSRRTETDYSSSSWRSHSARSQALEAGTSIGDVWETATADGDVWETVAADDDAWQPESTRAVSRTRVTTAEVGDRSSAATETPAQKFRQEIVNGSLRAVRTAAWDEDSENQASDAPTAGPW